MPTSPELVEKMLDMAQVTKDDLVMDLGSGDGRNIIAAAKRGARGIGVEFNPDMVALSRRAAEQAGVGDRATFVEADMFEADISKASVLALFLLTDNLAPPAAEVPRHASGQPDRHQHVHHSGLGARREGNDRRRVYELVHVAALDRAGEGRGHVADVIRRARACSRSSRWSPAR